MKDQSNIDKLFRNGLSNPSPHAFNESAWENMSDMLDQRDKMSWMSVGKLSAAALFLSTLFVASSSITDSTDLAKISTQVSGASKVEQPIEKANAQPVLASNQKQTKEIITVEPAQLTVTDTKTPEAFSNAVVIDHPATKNTKTKENWATVSNNMPFALPESNKDINPTDVSESTEVAQLNSRENLTLELVDSKTLTNIDVDFADAGFDPVDASNLPKSLNQSLSVFGGLMLENGLGTSPSLTASNLLYTAGFYYSVNVAKNFNISTGLSYRSKSGKGVELSRTQTTYGFGKTERTETLALDRLHYIDLPLEVSYDIKGKHSIIAGASIGYLAGVRSSLATKNEESLYASSEESKNTWNYRDGLNNFDANLRLGYDYQLQNNLSIGGMVQYGLLDITNDQTFNVVDNSNNLEVRVTLKYTPFKF